MQRKWAESYAIFLHYVAAKFGQSAKASLVARELIAAEVDSNILQKFKTKEEKEKHLSKLECWQQEEYQQTRDGFVKCSRIMCKDLASAYGILFSSCDASLR